MRRALCVKDKTQTAFMVRAAFTPFARVTNIQTYEKDMGNTRKFGLESRELDIELAFIPAEGYAQVAFQVRP